MSVRPTGPMTSRDATPNMPTKAIGGFSSFHERGETLLGTETVVDGRYRIDAKVGSGNLSDVYSAVDEKTEEKVALKFPVGRVMDIGYSTHFLRREIEALARIDHENVVRLLDIGFSKGMEFLVMEYLQGQDLESILGKNPLPWGTARPLLLQLCNALQATHDAGLIHGDLKPSNMFVLQKDGKQTLKLIDFGFTKFADTLDGDIDRTPPGFIVGSIDHMAPEQFDRDGHAKFDRRADVHATGVSMYEILSGRSPFDRGYLMGDYEIVSRIRNARPIPLCEWGVSIPDKAERAMMRALEKDPSKRFHSMEEMRSALD